MTAPVNGGAGPGERADVPRHRRPGQGIPSRLVVTVLILAALAVGGLLNSRTPDTDERERPFVTTGALGRPVSARTFDVTVLGVRGAVGLASSGELHDSGGVWILVKVRMVARSESTSVGYAALRDSDGRSYLVTSRVLQPMKSRSLQPGVPVEGEWAFEVPPAVATSLAVRFAAPLVTQRMDAMAEIPLKISRSMVDSWLKDKNPMRLIETETA